MGKGDPKGGRPRIEIDIDQLEKLVKMQCTAEECASVLGMCADTLDARLKEHGESGFSEYHKKHSAGGKASLRRMQWKSAQDGNVTAQIWLGKQYLGQKDKNENTHQNPDGSSIITGVVYTVLDPANAKLENGKD